MNFFGDYFHANPKYFKASQYFTQFQKTAEDIWKKDKYRLKTLKEVHGIESKIIWESDKNNEKLIDDLIEWVFEHKPSDLKD